MQHTNGGQSGSPSTSASPVSTPDASEWNSRQSSKGIPLRLDDTSQKRLSLDTTSSEYDYLTRSPLLEHESGLGPSGLPRIRQQPQSRAPSLPFTTDHHSLPSSATRSQSNVSSLESSTYLRDGITSPGVEDLHRFPSESLHSFSFAKQSEQLLNIRHNALKRSIDFVRDRFGPATGSASLTSAQARMTGDVELKYVTDILARASVLGNSDGPPQLHRLLGPATGPPDMERTNVFDKAFGANSQTTKSSPNAQMDAAVPDENHAEKGRLLSPPSSELRASRMRGLNSAPSSRRASLKRSNTDVTGVAMRTKLVDVLSEPYSASDYLPPLSALSASSFGLGNSGPGVHSHSSKWSPAAQAVFRTEAKPDWTVIAANDLACLVFGVAPSEIRKLSILDLIQKEKRSWLESKLLGSTYNPSKESEDMKSSNSAQTTSRPLGMRNGVTAQLLSKPPSRHKFMRRSQSGNGSSASPDPSNDGARASKNPNHMPTKSRGVLICGDVLPIQKRNGSTGSASFWVMEKRGGLIWIVEEITEHVTTVEFDDKGRVSEAHGDTRHIWGSLPVERGTDIFKLLPQFPERFPPGSKLPDFTQGKEQKYFTALSSGRSGIPVKVFPRSKPSDLRISSFPHVAGMMVLSAERLDIVSANSAFSAALFGYEHPEGSHITDLLPKFDDFLSILTEEDDVPLVDGVVIPEHSFRRARALSILRDRDISSASVLARPVGLSARHRDGSEIMVDVQMRVVRSESIFPANKAPRFSSHQEPDSENGSGVSVTEVVFALWVTYSQQLHSITLEDQVASSRLMQPIRKSTSHTQLSPGQRSPGPRPTDVPVVEPPELENKSQVSLLSQKLNEAASEPLSDMPVQPVPQVNIAPNAKEPPAKKSISDYVILEEMGEGAYGQVKLGRSRWDPSKKVVLKFVTKNRILVDTWTRDRRLGTVPLEIHVLDFLRRDGFRHPNIVEMEGFFEDNVNYYIEMVPHGLPGMDLFDYVELKTNMDEKECRNIFSQVTSAIYHLHTKALVVHRDIKDENVILDGDGRIKLIDFGSAAYIKNGPFDVFVGTIDYAAPEVLQGRPYRGKEQDVWALGILLYTMIYKENPFYNINEIMDHPLRIPFLPFSEDCIDLIRKMLNRDVDERLTITEVIEHPWMQAGDNR